MLAAVSVPCEVALALGLAALALATINASALREIDRRRERLGHGIASFALAVARVANFRSPAFQALAHLYVGGLFLAGCYAKGSRAVLWFNGSVLTFTIELPMFLIQH